MQMKKIQLISQRVRRTRHTWLGILFGLFLFFSLGQRSLTARNMKCIYINSTLFLTVASVQDRPHLLPVHRRNSMAGKKVFLPFNEKTRRSRTPLYFNPSIIALQNGSIWQQSLKIFGTSTRFLLVFRRAFSQWGPSDIMAVWLDHQLNVINQNPIHLSLSNHADGNWLGTPWNEDPRLFLVGDDVGLSYTVVCAYDKDADGVGYKVWQRQGFMVLGRNLKPMVKDVFPSINRNFDFPTYPYFEKNWGFFDLDGDLCALYTIQPFVIYCNLRWSPKKVLEMAWKHPLHMSSNDLRGGTPPVRVGDIFYAFVHSSSYDIYAIRFSALDLRLTGYSLLPIMSSGSILFPCGAVFVEEKQLWLISTGVDDMQMHIIEMHHSRLIHLHEL